MKIRFSPWLFFLFSFSGILLLFGQRPQKEELPLYAPEENLMENLDSRLPQAHRVALSRINEYRRAAGLPLWRYDESLSRMGNAHARYVALNCKEKRPSRGHYENPAFPGYSKEGDEAARTSGLTGGSNPLSGLESLMAGVYHRVQFIRPVSMRVGVGFEYDEESQCSSVLFVSRPMEKTDQKETPPRFLMFPPPNMKGVPLAFHAEWPEPRPVQNDPNWKGGTTGYVISIHLNSRDTQDFETADAVLTDSQGNKVDLWVTHPGNPTWKTPPPDIEKIYAGYSGGNPFSKNFNAVFIMPKQILIPGENYTVSVSMRIAGKTEVLEWSFETVKNQRFLAKPDTSGTSIHSLRFIASQKISGDAILFSQGRFEMTPQWFSGNLILSGEGVEKTLLSIKDAGEKNKSQHLFNFKPGHYRMENLTFEGQKGKFFYLQSQAILTLNQVRIQNAPHGVALMMPDSEAVFENCRIENVGNKKINPFFVWNEKNGLPSARLIFAQGNEFKNIMESLRYGGVGALSQSGRIWKVSKSGLSLKDALNLAASQEMIQLEEGVYELSEGVWIPVSLTFEGQGKGTRIQAAPDYTNYLFLTQKQGQAHFRNLSLSSPGFFFYVSGEGKIFLDQVQIEGKNKQLGVLRDHGQIIIENSDLENYFSPWIFSMEGDSRYEIRNTRFSAGKLPKVFRNKTSEELTVQ